MISYIRQLLQTYIMTNEFESEFGGEFNNVMYFSFIDKDDPSQDEWIEYEAYFAIDEYLDVNIYNAIREQFPHVKNITGTCLKAEKYPKVLGIFSSRKIPVFVG